MDGRISVTPAVFHSAWRDTGLVAARRLQPQVWESAAQASTPPSDPAAGRAGSVAGNPALDDRSTYDARGRVSASAGLFAAARWERADSVELQVTTAEGDVATLSFSQFSSVTMAAGAVRAGGASATALAWDAESAEESDIRVAGDLNDQELAAIEALAERLAQVADEFFGGDLDAALSSAGQISISEDAQTLSAFSYSMRSQEVLAATALYERVAEATDGLAVSDKTAPIEPVPVGASELDAGDDNGPRDLLKQILDLLRSLAVELGTDPDQLPWSLPAQTQEPAASTPQQDAPLIGA